MSSRPLVTTLAVLVVAGPAAAVSTPPTRTPQQAVDAVKKIVTRNTKPCTLDWAKIKATGFEGNWSVKVLVRSSEAGKGLGKWHIGGGRPVAVNHLAKAISHGCK